MQKREYQKDLREAKGHLDGLLRQRQDIDKDIAQVQLRIHHLEALCRDLKQIDIAEKKASSESLQGLTHEISKTLEGNFLGMTARQVMENTASRGFDFSTYSNPMAAIHTVLKRLVKAQKVKIISKEKGKKEYKWYSDFEKACDILNRAAQGLLAQSKATPTKHEVRSSVKSTR
jgi:hypothetical protein